MSNETSSSYVAANDDMMVVEEIEIQHSSNGTCIALKTGNDDLTEYLNTIVDELLEQDLVQKWKAEFKALSDK